MEWMPKTQNFPSRSGRIESHVGHPNLWVQHQKDEPPKSVRIKSRRTTELSVPQQRAENLLLKGLNADIFALRSRAKAAGRQKMAKST